MHPTQMSFKVGFLVKSLTAIFDGIGKARLEPAFVLLVPLIVELVSVHLPARALRPARSILPSILDYLKIIIQFLSVNPFGTSCEGHYPNFLLNTIFNEKKSNSVL